MAQNEGIQGLARWNFRTQHVQRELDPQDFINAHTTLIACGPPRIVSPGDLVGADAAAAARIQSTYLFPMGVVENMTLVQNRQLQILFEIGSKRQYYIPGRVIPQISFARTLFHGPNIMRALYAYYPAKFLPGRTTDIAQPSIAAFKEITACPVQENPGFEDLFVNLNSDLFDKPFGLLVILKDECGSPYGSIYLENAFINNHQLSVNASSTLVAEGVTVQFERIVPVDIGAVSAALRASQEVTADVLG